MGQRVNDGRAEQPLIERIKREQRRYEIAREVTAAVHANEAARERDRWYKAAHDGIDNVAEALSRTEQELAAERQRAEQAEQREARLRAALEFVREHSGDPVMERAIDAALAEGQDVG